MKRKLLLLLLFLICISITNAFAQPIIKKQKTMGGSADDEFTCMDKTKDGGLIIGGSSYSNKSFEKTANSKGSSDFWLVKQNKKGKIEWDKTFGGSEVDYMTAVKQTADGGYILGGYSSSGISGNKSEINRGTSSDSHDYWIIKLDAAGNKQWDKTIGGDDDDILYSVEPTTDGGYILGGYSQSNASSEKSENRRGAEINTDFWIVKLDSMGNKEWDKTIGGDKYDLCYALHQTLDGGYIAGGRSQSDISAEKTENSKGDYDFWVIKLNEAGNIEWDKTLGGSNSDELKAIQQTKDRGYILGGSSWSQVSGDKSQGSRGAVDYWVVRIDASGNKQWDRTIGGSNQDYLSSLQEASDGGFIVAGGSASPISGDKTENHKKSSSDYWIIKLGNTGNILWDKTIGGSKTDSPADIKEIKQNQYIIGGISDSNISFDKTENSRGGRDYWLVLITDNLSSTISTITEINNSKYGALNNHKFIAYPNPAKDILYIQNTGKATVTLTHQSGKVLLTKTINGSGAINVAHLSAGLYYLKNNETGAIQKVIIAK